MATYYRPTQKMITALLLDAGFTEQVIAPADRIGGAVFHREHADGRQQMAYVFAWSNFSIAEKEGILPCRLCIRITTDVPAPGPEAWKSAPLGSHVYIAFEKDGWDHVEKTFTSHILPVYDAAAADADDMLLTLQNELDIAPRAAKVSA
jgi:hypothetical protein